MNNETVVVTGAANIARVRFLTMLNGLKLELQGMRLTRGRTCYAMLKQELGLKGSRASVLKQCEQIAEQMKNEEN